MTLQYAEIALRRHLGETTAGRRPVRVPDATDDGVVTAVFAARGASYAVARPLHDVRRAERLTCSATRDNASVRHELVGLDPVHSSDPRTAADPTPA